MSLRRFLRLAPKVLLGLLLVAGIGVAVLFGPYAWRVQHVDAAPANGFHSGYYLYVPASLQRDADGVATLLVQPNNSGRVSDDLATHRRDAWMTGFEHKQVAEELGVALLVRAFPRFELGPGVGHDRKALQARSTAFFRQVLATPR